MKAIKSQVIIILCIFFILLASRLTLAQTEGCCEYSPVPGEPFPCSFGGCSPGTVVIVGKTYTYNSKGEVIGTIYWYVEKGTGTGTEIEKCTPGTTRACDAFYNCPGTQTCKSDGQWGDCINNDPAHCPSTCLLACQKKGYSTANCRIGLNCQADEYNIGLTDDCNVTYHKPPPGSDEAIEIEHTCCCSNPISNPTSYLGYSWTKPGEYEVYAEGKDLNGNTIKSNKIIITVLNTPPPPPPPPPSQCQILEFSINGKNNETNNPLIVFVNTNLKGYFSVTDQCQECTVTSNDNWNKAYSLSDLSPTYDITEIFKIPTPGTYSYTLKCVGADPENMDLDVISLGIVEAKNLPWWKEIIPYLNLQGFLRGLFR